MTASCSSDTPSPRPLYRRSTARRPMRMTGIGSGMLRRSFRRRLRSSVRTPTGSSTRNAARLQVEAGKGSRGAAALVEDRAFIQPLAQSRLPGTRNRNDRHRPRSGKPAPARSIGEDAATLQQLREPVRRTRRALDDVVERPPRLLRHRQVPLVWDDLGGFPDERHREVRDGARPEIAAARSTSSFSCGVSRRSRRPVFIPVVVRQQSLQSDHVEAGTVCGWASDSPAPASRLCCCDSVALPIWISRAQACSTTGTSTVRTPSE